MRRRCRRVGYQTGTDGIEDSGQFARLSGLLASRKDLLRDYFAAISGSAGRLVFSLLYFVALANALSIEDFGRFATASAAGVMLSRILAFGFVSTLYRIATVKPLLIGTFTAGFLLAAFLSLPLLAAAAWLTHRLFFSDQVPLELFAAIVVAEALLWRGMEVAVIVNNGMGRFGRAAVLVVLGTLFRAIAATVFIFWSSHSLATWTAFHLAANAAGLLAAIAAFYPRRRLRLRLGLYWRRMPDSLYVAGAEILFYLQMEMDKLLVLSLGGPRLAGIYAIIMRLVDLTAIPIRAFSMMLVQKMMRAPQMLSSMGVRIGIEAGVLAVSTAALLAAALLLHFFPNALGRNVGEAAPLLLLVLLVPGLRNLVEYQAELLFARGQTLIRAINLALLAALKAVLLTWILTNITETRELAWSLNPAVGLIYLVSALLTYTALRRPAKPV